MWLDANTIAAAEYFFCGVCLKIQTYPSLIFPPSLHRRSGERNVAEVNKATIIPSPVEGSRHKNFMKTWLWDASTELGMTPCEYEGPVTVGRNDRKYFFNKVL